MQGSVAARWPAQPSEAWVGLARSKEGVDVGRGELLGVDGWGKRGHVGVFGGASEATTVFYGLLERGTVVVVVVGTWVAGGAQAPHRVRHIGLAHEALLRLALD